MEELNLIGIAGSLRKDSFNKALLRNAQALSSDSVNIKPVEIGNLPHFNEDVESANYPEVASNLKQQIKTADGVIVSTPEYNRSMPGVLKNAIDWSSRPPNDNAWAGQKVLVLGATIGPISTAIAQSHLKHTLLYLDCLVLGQPEFYLGNAYDKFDENGNLTDDQTNDFLQKTLDRFVEFVED